MFYAISLDRRQNPFRPLPLLRQRLPSECRYHGGSCGISEWCSSLHRNDVRTPVPGISHHSQMTIKWDNMGFEVSRVDLLSFADACRRGRDADCNTPEEAMKDLMFVEACLKSGQNNDERIITLL
eukprot:scaffold29773_cov51-Attheya_sp.AAC.3